MLSYLSLPLFYASIIIEIFASVVHKKGLFLKKGERKKPKIGGKPEKKVNFVIENVDENENKEELIKDYKSIMDKSVSIGIVVINKNLDIQYFNESFF